jgi:hypothetical protein
MITPIIIPQKEDDEYITCPKCQHRFKDEESGGLLGTLIGIALAIAAAFVVVAGFIMATPYLVDFIGWAWK